MIQVKLFTADSDTGEFYSLENNVNEFLSKIDEDNIKSVEHETKAYSRSVHHSIFITYREENKNNGKK